MTNELDKDALEKAIDTYNNSSFNSAEQEIIALRNTIQTYLDETNLQEKLKAAEEALEYASQINSNLLADEYIAVLGSSNAVINEALKQIRGENA